MSDEFFGTQYNRKSPSMISYERLNNEYIVSFDQDDITLKEELGNSFEILDAFSDSWVIADAYFDEEGKLHIFNKFSNSIDGFRYAWHNYPDVTLFNKYGIPVLPFNSTVNVNEVPDFSKLHTDEDTLNVPCHNLKNGDYIINVTNGFEYRQIEVVDSSVMNLSEEVEDQKIGDIIVKLERVSDSISNLNTNDTELVIDAHGLQKGDFIINESRNSELRKVISVIDENTIQVLKISNQSAGDIITLLKNNGSFFAQ